MAATVLMSTKNLAREDWLQARNQGIGGSDIPAILGLSKYRSVLDVWLEKTGQVTPPELSSEAAYWGTRLEDIVADEFKIRNPGYLVNRRNAILQHPVYPWMLANIDREMHHADEGRGVLEIKTTSVFAGDDWEDDRVPLTAQAQVQWYLGVTGYQYAYVAALIGGQRYVQSRIERDDATITNMIGVAQAFWQHVTDRTIPAIDGSDSCAETLARMFPESNPAASIDLPPSIDLRVYDDLCAAIKELERQKGEIENTIKAEMGDAETAYADGRIVTWKTIESTRLDGKALRAAHSDLYDEFSAVSRYRRFDVKKAK